MADTDSNMTLDDFCGQFGMVVKDGVDGSQTVEDFLADKSISDDVKMDAAIRTLIDGESDTDAIRDALADYANA